MPLKAGIAGHVATTGQILNIPEAYNDPRFNNDVDKKTGYRTRNILCVPIYNEQETIIGVTQLINKSNGNFTLEDEEILRAFSIFCAITLRNASLYKQAIQSQHKTQALLDVAMAISSETNIQGLLKSIMKHARRCVKADRASLFLLDPQNGELRSQVAEGVEEIIIPSTDGLVGHVASTGEEICLPDAYVDERFNPLVDEMTGYKTKSVLCLPLKNIDGTIIGVTQMINKREGIFSKEDRDLLQAFAIFASRSMTLSLATIPLPLKMASLADDPRFIPTEADKKAVLSWSFDALSYTREDLIRLVLAMFDIAGITKGFNIPTDRLFNLIVAISKAYRDVPYHNFWHAVDVTQVST